MQQEIHPEHGPVAFRDRPAGRALVTRSPLVTRETDKTAEVDGRTYPVVDVDITRDSHPFWTGRTRTLDTEGRVEAFQRRYGRKP